MVYISSLAQQTRLFLYAFGFGFLLGILYDVFRTVRLIFSNSRLAAWVADIVYLICVSLLTFGFVLVLNSGKLQGYVLAGEVLGWLVYYFSTGSIAVRVSNAIIKAVRTVSSGVFNAAKSPFLFVGGKIKKKSRKTSDFFKKTFRKFKKNNKMLLQNQHNILYNVKALIYSEPEADYDKDKK